MRPFGISTWNLLKKNSHIFPFSDFFPSLLLVYFSDSNAVHVHTYKIIIVIRQFLMRLLKDKILVELFIRHFFFFHSTENEPPARMTLSTIFSGKKVWGGFKTDRDKKKIQVVFASISFQNMRSRVCVFAWGYIRGDKCVGGVMNIYKTWLICSTAKCGQGNCVASSTSWVVKDYLSWKSAFGNLQFFFLPGFEHRLQMKVGTHNYLTSSTDYTHARTRTHIYSSSECRFK